MRQIISFLCDGNNLAGSLDTGNLETGLLIVSGGNEIRSGAHAGQSRLAANIAAAGFPVFRYDRRGIGDSEGENNGFDSSADDIAAAIATFRVAVPDIKRIVAFGNCDAASALALFHDGNGIDGLVLANPWVLEPSSENADAPAQPSSAAIRARYWARIKNPRSLLDLITGKINISKLANGLARASQKDGPNDLANRIADALCNSNCATKILLARRDTTAMAFMAAWKEPGFAPLRERANVSLAIADTASHSFADEHANAWLLEQLFGHLRG
jgi:exosortase A-associated hydrolase 1